MLSAHVAQFKDTQGPLSLHRFRGKTLVGFSGIQVFEVWGYLSGKDFKSY